MNNLSLSILILVMGVILIYDSFVHLTKLDATFKEEL